MYIDEGNEPVMHGSIMKREKDMAVVTGSCQCEG